MTRSPCPCCGFLTLADRPPGTYAICPVCWWEDDDVQARDPDHTGGANRLSLRQAQESFGRCGASDPEALSKVRPPTADEQPDLMNARAERLHQFFGGYFHQDWGADGASSWSDVVDAYLAENTLEDAASLRDALRAWVTDGQLGDLASCDYDPRAEGLTERAWVAMIAEYIDRRITPL
jgi:hypothetical protein